MAAVVFQSALLPSADAACASPRAPAAGRAISQKSLRPRRVGYEDVDTEGALGSPLSQSPPASSRIHSLKKVEDCLSKESSEAKC
ncbi:hypothetical protein Y1Q_0007918 [Alligator mississippiensis]|uniref:Uncharacterized protein n=1 Tax=Alligator mississippiensis TaxID=8496 RepID=A0A151NF07_ALLMI|nr:hypothetical protein Y1Q_0007918 [Alligator mississippiensis]